MSIEVSYRNRQRRLLGILRNSYPPNIIVQNHHRACTPTNICSKSAGLTHDSPFATSDQFYKEKLRKLHQIRIENAVRQIKSASVTRNDSPNLKVSSEEPSKRCSTAPTSGNQNLLEKHQINWNRAQTPLLFKEKYETNLTPSLIKKSPLPTLEKKLQNDAMYRQTSAFLKRIETPVLHSRRRARGVVLLNKISQNTFPRATSANHSRATSAPALGPEVLRQSTVNASQLRRNNHGSKLLGAGDRLRHVGTPLFGRSLTGEVVATRDGLIRFDEGPLGIVGSPCVPCRPQHEVTFHRSPARAVKTPSKTPVRPRVDITPKNPPPSPRTICLVPEKPNTGCTCRSVRFSCTDNLVHEYKSNEPIASENDDVFN